MYLCIFTLVRQPHCGDGIPTSWSSASIVASRPSIHSGRDAPFRRYSPHKNASQSFLWGSPPGYEMLIPYPERRLHGLYSGIWILFRRRFADEWRKTILQEFLSRLYRLCRWDWQNKDHRRRGIAALTVKKRRILCGLRLYSCEGSPISHSH